MQKRHMMYVCNKKKKLCAKVSKWNGLFQNKNKQEGSQVEDMEFPGVLKEYPRDLWSISDVQICCFAV